MALRRQREHRRQQAGDDVMNVRETVDTVVRRVVGSRDPDYEDLVQSSLLNVLATIDRGKFRGECPPGGWAAVIARNVAVDSIRARTRERRVFAQDEGSELEFVLHQDTSDGPERLTEVRMTLHRVRQALVGLGTNKSNVVVLHDVLGYGLEEIATILGTTVAAAQSRLVRGRREIVAKLHDEAAERPRQRKGAPRRGPRRPSKTKMRSPRHKRRPAPIVLT